MQVHITWEPSLLYYNLVRHRALVSMMGVCRQQCTMRNNLIVQLLFLSLGTSLFMVYAGS